MTADCAFLCKETNILLVKAGAGKPQTPRSCSVLSVETEREDRADLGQDRQQVLMQDKVVQLPCRQHSSTRPRLLLRRKVPRSSQQSCLSNCCFNTSFPIYELVTILTYRTWLIRCQSSSTGCRKLCPQFSKTTKPGQQCLMNLPSPFVLDNVPENRRAAKETNVSCCLWMTWVSWHLDDNCGTHCQNSPESGNPPSSMSLSCFPREKKTKKTPPDIWTRK